MELVSGLCMACEMVRLNKGPSRDPRVGNEHKDVGEHTSDPAGAKEVASPLELILVWTEARDSWGAIIGAGVEGSKLAETKGIPVSLGS